MQPRFFFFQNFPKMQALHCSSTVHKAKETVDSAFINGLAAVLGTKRKIHGQAEVCPHHCLQPTLLPKGALLKLKVLFVDKGQGYKHLYENIPLMYLHVGQGKKGEHSNVHFLVTVFLCSE